MDSRGSWRAFGVALAAAGLLVSACGSPTGAGGAPGSPGNLLVWVGTGTGGEAMREIAGGFGEQLGVDVTVELVPGENLQTNFVTASQGNNPPDIVCGAHDWIGNLVQNGTIDPIQLSEATAETLQPLAVEAVTYNGQVYGMPFTMNNLVLYRNTELVPDAPETIEELVAAGQQLVASGQVSEVLAYPVSNTGNPYFIHPLYTSGGGYMFGEDPDGGFDPTDLGVGGPGSIEAYEKIAALGERGQGVLKRSIGADNALSLFLEGETAFLVEGPWQLPPLGDSDVDFDVSPVPGFADGDTASPFITVDACYVASGGGNKTLAQEFVANFWGEPDTQVSYFEAAEGVPASLEVLEQIRDDNPQVAKAADIGAEYGQIMPSIPEMAAVWTPLGQAEAAVIAGADPASTLTSAGTAIQQAIG
jgi:arabinogalactan oligomer/maltooligosaccharide transport system substrate-binding protein